MIDAGFTAVPGTQIVGPPTSHAVDVLTPEAVGFVAQLHRSFNQRRLQLLGQRRERQAAILVAPP